MKKLKLILVATTLIFGLCFMTGCETEKKKENDENQTIEEKSVAKSLAQQFQDEMKGEADIKKVADKISKNESLQIQIDVSIVGEEDYISGFQTEIKDFNKAVVMRPMIGTIPFIAYIFETENPKELAETLKSNADLRWNICTEADDMEVSIVDNYVFFIMSPENFEE